MGLFKSAEERAAVRQDLALTQEITNRLEVLENSVAGKADVYSLRKISRVPVAQRVNPETGEVDLLYRDAVESVCRDLNGRCQSLSPQSTLWEADLPKRMAQIADGLLEADRQIHAPLTLMRGAIELSNRMEQERDETILDRFDYSHFVSSILSVANENTALHKDQPINVWDLMSLQQMNRDLCSCPRWSMIRHSLMEEVSSYFLSHKKDYLLSSLEEFTERASACVVTIEGQEELSGTGRILADFLKDPASFYDEKKETSVWPFLVTGLMKGGASVSYELTSAVIDHVLGRLSDKKEVKKILGAFKPGNYGNMCREILSETRGAFSWALRHKASEEGQALDARKSETVDSVTQENARLVFEHKMQKAGEVVTAALLEQEAHSYALDILRANVEAITGNTAADLEAARDALSGEAWQIGGKMQAIVPLGEKIEIREVSPQKIRPNTENMAAFLMETDHLTLFNLEDKKFSDLMASEAQKQFEKKLKFLPRYEGEGGAYRAIMDRAWARRAAAQQAKVTASTPQA